MTSRIRYLVSYFALVWAYFIVEKPVFMACNAARPYALSDYLAVMAHGAKLDATTAAYLCIVPWLLTAVSVWWHRLPLRKATLPYDALVMLVTATVFVADASLFAFWESKIDASVFIYIDSPRNAMASVSAGYLVLRLLLIVLMAAATTWGLWRVTPRHLTPIPSTVRKVAATLCALPVGGLLFLAIRGGVGVSTANVGDVYYSSDQYLNLSAINPTFNLLSSIGRQQRFEDEYDFLPEGDRRKTMEGLYPQGDGGTVPLLTTTRPDILVIFMEGFGGTMVGRLGGARGVSPCLDSLSREGVFFSGVYANSFRTDRGTVCAFSGFPGLPTVSVMKVPSLCQGMPGIAASLAAAGYDTDFLYGGDINFTNMQGYLRMTGFRRLTSQTDFALTDGNFSKWGVRDDLTFRRLKEMIGRRKAHGGRPWFTAFLTLSSHEPFDVPFSRFSDIRYNAFAYTDDCIGRFMRWFRKTPQWRNTLVILLPDHGTPYPHEGERFGPRYFRIPMIWTGGALARHGVTVDRIMNQTDLAATLLGQLRIAHGDFEFSRNVLSRDYRRPHAFYSFPDGFCYLDSTGVSVYDNASGKVFYREGSVSGDSLRVHKGKAILQTLYDRLGAINSRRYRKH